MTVKHITIDDVLLGEGLVGSGSPGTAIDRQRAVGHVTHGIDQGGIVGIRIGRRQIGRGEHHVARTFADGRALIHRCRGIIIDRGNSNRKGLSR